MNKIEQGFLSKLVAWSGREDRALRFTWQVINCRPVTDELWRIPSGKVEDQFYEVNLELRQCSCDGYSFKHRCYHLEVADRAARLRYEFTHAVAQGSQRTVADSTYRVTLKSQPSAGAADARGTDDNIRLRQLLKVALRTFGFRCLKIEC